MSDTRSHLSPDQIRYLQAPIWFGALRQDADAAKGNVYVPGQYVIGQLNRVFGFDGWDAEILALTREHFERTEKDGKARYRGLWSCHIRLTVRCPDGSALVRHGVGADEKVSANMVDVYRQATASAYTYALKDAAITLGSQFGLDTVRAGKRADGSKVDWRRRTVDSHPKPPVFAGTIDADLARIQGEVDEGDEIIEEGGVRYNGRTGVVEEPPSAAPATNRVAPPVDPPSQMVSRDHSPPITDRAALVLASREAFRAIGAGPGQAVFARLAREHGYQGAMPAIGRPEAQGGATTAFLQAFVAALSAEAARGAP